MGSCVVIIRRTNIPFSSPQPKTKPFSNPSLQETLRGSTLNFLLLNLCFSNLLISFLVKPISAIYVGYAISTGEWHVGLAFCTLYTFTYRTTWCATNNRRYSHEYQLVSPSSALKEGQVGLA